MLKTKMFLSFSIVSLFIVAITCGMFYFKYSNDIQDQTSSLSSVISKQFSEMVDLYMQNIEELSLAVSISPAVQNGLLNYIRASNSLEKEIIGYKLNPFLFDFSYPKPYVQSISIHTLDAYMYYYTKLVELKPAVPYTQPELLEFKQALENRKFILRPSVGAAGVEEPANRIVSFIRRINRIPTQQTIGYVNININVNAFKALESANSKASGLDSSMSMLLVDDKGEIIYANNNRPNDAKRETFDVNLLQTGLSEGELQWKNKGYFYSYESSDYTGWKTIVLIPKDIVLLKQKRIQQIVLAVGVLTMTLIALVSYMLSHQITVPLRKLMLKMSSVELGNFNERMDYKGKNELGKLSRMYNLMLDSISRLIHEVYESKLAEKNAQLSALHAQINPHFLYNTLNIMKSISRLRGIEEVAEISESLASLFQYSMKNLHQPVTLERELEHIGHYFNIQQHRFGNRMRLDVQIPDYLYQAEMLKLTIQPLIENAVDHGIRRMKAGGCIRVEAKVFEGMLLVSVTDNGEGIEAARLQALQAAIHSTSALQGLRDAADGIGLLNIHQRLHLYYGASSGLTISCPPGGGTNVRISLPLRLVKQEEACRNFMNIFVVEDEYWALAELVELFRIYEPKHKVYPFDNGEDALLAAKTVHPHLVVTDINMPGLDGLGLAEKLNQLDASIKKIIVSVHDQFEYARQGMKFGVADFLVKPVKKDVLYKAVDHMLEQLIQESKYTEEWLHGSLVQMLLTPDPSEHPKLRRFYSDACHVLLLQLDEGTACTHWKETQLDIERLVSVFAGSTSAQIHGLELNGRQRVLLIPENREWETYVRKHLADLSDQLQSPGHYLHIGIAVKPANQSLFETYSRLSQRLIDERLFGTRSLVLSHEKRADADLSGAWDRVRVLETHYKKGELAKGKAALQGMLQELQHKEVTKRQLALFVGDMLFSLKFNKYGTRSGGVGVHDLYEEPGLLLHLSGYDELLACLHDKIVHLYGEEVSKETNPKELIAVLLKVIHHHYQRPISLQQFASEHHVSLGYLSRMFKTQTGLTFSEYVTEYRIRKAQELLSGGIERLQEVSRLVGYEDPKHFSALFKKQVGESPMMYAKRRVESSNQNRKK